MGISCSKQKFDNMKKDKRGSEELEEECKEEGEEHKKEEEDKSVDEGVLNIKSVRLTLENGARRGSSKMIKNQRNELNLSLEFSEEQEKKRKEKNGKESEVHLDYGNLLRHLTPENDVKYIPKFSKRDKQDYDELNGEDRVFSDAKEWQKLIERFEKKMNTVNKIRDDLYKTCYTEEIMLVEEILETQERKWYNELIQIKIDKLTSKKKNHFAFARFERKKIQLKEHFKYFSHAVTSKVFGFSRLTKTCGMKNKRTYSKKMKLPKNKHHLDPNDTSMGNKVNGGKRGPGALMDSSTAMSKITIGKKMRPSVNKKGKKRGIGSITNIMSPESKIVMPQRSQISVRPFNLNNNSISVNSINTLSKREAIEPPNSVFYLNQKNSPSKSLLKLRFSGRFVASIPDYCSDLWTKGFVYKGVFFKKVSSNNIQRYKRFIEKMKILGLSLMNRTVSKIIVKEEEYHTVGLVANFIENQNFGIFSTPIAFSIAEEEECSMVQDAKLRIVQSMNLNAQERVLRHPKINDALGRQYENITIHCCYADPEDLESHTRMILPINLSFLVENTRPTSKLTKLLSNVMIQRPHDSHLSFLMNEAEGDTIQKANLADLSVVLGFPKDEFSKSIAKHIERFKLRTTPHVNFFYETDIIKIGREEKCLIVKIKRSDSVIISLSKIPEEDNILKGKLANNLKEDEPLSPYNRNASDFISSFCNILIDVFGSCAFIVLSTNDFIIPLSVKEERTSLEFILGTLETNDNYLNFEGLEVLIDRTYLSKDHAILLLYMTEDQRVLRYIENYIFILIIKAIMIEASSKNTQDYSRQKSSFDINSGQSYRESIVKLLNSMLNLEGLYTKTQETFFLRFKSELLLLKINMFQKAKKVLSPSQLNMYMSNTKFSDITFAPFKELTLFFEGIKSVLRFKFNHKLSKRIRDDKFCLYINPCLKSIKVSQIRGPFTQFASISSLKDFSLFQLEKIAAKSLSSLSGFNSIYLANPFHSITSLVYSELANDNVVGEILYDDAQDWLIQLESLLISTKSVNCEQSFLINIYTIFTIFQVFDGDIEGAKTTYDKLINHLNSVCIHEPNTLISVYALGGIIFEDSSLADAEQQYLMAILVCHKAWGDPRGRGNVGRPIELFLAWRLSIICRIQGKIFDAEYAEEIFDAVLLGLKSTDYSKFMRVYDVYKYRYFDYESQSDFSSSKSLKESNSFLKDISLLATSQLEHKKDLRFEPDLGLGHPFSHWTNHMILIEKLKPKDVIKQTLFENHLLRDWIISNFPIFHVNILKWNSGDVKKFYVTTMQTSVNLGTSLSSDYSYSNRNTHTNMKKPNSNRSFNIPSSASQRQMLNSPNPKKERLFKFNGGNIVNSFENDYDTLNYKSLTGRSFSWGLNNDGQLGSILQTSLEGKLYLKRRIKVFHPRLIAPLKDILVSSISCGYAHTMAITFNQNLLGWGCNKSHQLGLGDKAPNFVSVPAPIPGLYNIRQVECGSEHTVALLHNDEIYTWGQGEGGLLGHGDTETKTRPKRVEDLVGKRFERICCGGLHTLALTVKGKIYSWGRGEGGQLGLEFSKIYVSEDQMEVYCVKPTRITTIFRDIVITQIAAGDAHSIALTTKGHVYGWGFTSSGQLGTGDTAENLGMNSPRIQIKIPKLLSPLKTKTITHIYAGQTFSFFVESSGDTWACGLNDFNQLGIQRQGIHQKTKKNFKLTEVPLPMRVQSIRNIRIVNIECGANHSIASAVINNRHALVTWGMNKQAQLGIGNIKKQNVMPVLVKQFNDTPVYKMSSGAYHTAITIGETQFGFNKFNHEIFKLLIHRIAPGRFFDSLKKGSFDNDVTKFEGERGDRTTSSFRILNYKL